MGDLEQAISAVVRDCMGVRDGENVLVICNPATRDLGERMRTEAEAAGADAVLTVMSERESHAAEPPEPIAAAMTKADAVLAPTVQSLSHTAARNAATSDGVRIATLPGVTEEMLARVMSADMEGLRRKGKAIASVLTNGGEAGERLTGLLTAHGPDGTSVAELGIGSNEKAILTGNVLEDEKILGTAHVAFGASAAFGGTVQVPVHLDCVVLEPDVSIDGEPLVRAGELLV